MEVLTPMSSCRSLSPLFLKVNAKKLTGQVQSTPPWSVLDSIKGARTRAREIQVAPWSVNSAGSSFSRELYRGEEDVVTEGFLACTPGFVSCGIGLLVQ